MPQFTALKSPIAGFAVTAVALTIAACADSPEEGTRTVPASGVGEQQVVQLLARIAPAAGRAGGAEAMPGVNGEILSFRSDLSAAERRMVAGVLPDKIAISGGIDAARIELAYADLDSDGIDEAFVFIKSGPYCGSGDVCNFWILRRGEPGWVQINGDDDAANALEVLPTSTLGHRDVRIHGQCGLEECDFLLSWDGSAYQWVNDPTPTPAG